MKKASDQKKRKVWVSETDDRKKNKQTDNDDDQSYQQTGNIDHLLTELRRMTQAGAAGGGDAKKTTKNEDLEEDEYEKFLREYAMAPRKPTYGPIIGNLNDWHDDQLKSLKIVALRCLDHEQICTMGEKAFNSIHGKLTTKAIGMLMVLAYNLMDDNGHRLMKKYDAILVDIGSSTPVDWIEEVKLCDGQMKNMIVNISNVDVETCRRRAIGYCYLAASYLRLFTKLADNYQKADKQLKGKFTNYYKFEFPFDEFHPDINVIQAIKKQFEIDSQFRNTLYVILSYGRAEPQGQSLKEFLYTSDLNYTGLQTYVLYLRAMQNLDVNSGQLGKLIYIPMFKQQLEAVLKLLELEHSHEPEYRRQMWKFGRLFDRNFMKVLQIKNCVVFGLVLAYIVSETSSSNKEGPLKITGLREASSGDKDLALRIAVKAIQLCRSKTLGQITKH